MSLSVFLFHRDFRLYDHRPLQEALKEGNVLPLFIFTPIQVGKEAPIRSEKSVACMIQGLTELDEELEKKFKTNLCVCYGDNVTVLEQLYRKHKFTALYETKDYTPFAVKREKAISGFCKKHNIKFEAIDDLYLFPPGSILNKSGKIYQKFTPFYEAASKKKVPDALGLVKGNFESSKLANSLSNTSLKEMSNKILGGHKEVDDRFYQGGRREGLELLSTLPASYNKTRDIMQVESSGLSTHHHFGTISIRETYHKSKGHAGLTEFVRQLFWRDFYGHLTCFFEELYGYDIIEYQKNWKVSDKQKKNFEAWTRAETEEPLVNAAMTQLNTSGYIHNRGRLLVASYLVKTLGVPWRLGERYFAEHLCDYSISMNTLNWMFVSSVGLPFCEAPFRQHNPDSYAKRFDPDGVYQNEWLNQESEK